MTQTGRFQTKKPLREQGGVRSYEGLDALTGLPVLIYRFPGRPMPSIGELESDNIPGILHSSFDGLEGELVVAFAPSYKPLTDPVTPSGVLALLLDSATALKDAAHAGVIHGNLKPERFLRGNGHHLIEGYGVRWAAEASPYTAPEALVGASFPGDVFSWAKSAEFLCGPHLPEELAPLVQASLSLDPQERPLARTLHEAVSTLAEAVMRDSPDSGIAPHITGVFEPYAVAPEDGGMDESWGGRGGEDGGEGGGGESGGGEAESDPGFVRRLPPGAKYRDGAAAEAPPPAPIVLPKEERKGVGFPPGRSRRPLLLVALAASVAVLAFLALLWQRPSEFASRYPVTIAVQPDDVQGARVVVVSAPPGAEYRPGREIRNVPGRIELERGEWVVQAVYQNRLSDHVRFSVPEQRSITVAIPPQGN